MRPRFAIACDLVATSPRSCTPVLHAGLARRSCTKRASGTVVLDRGRALASAGKAGTVVESPGADEGERLQKLLAAAGLGSRRACEKMILDGRVSVNGVKAHIGQRARRGADRIAVDDVPLPETETFAYYLVNKPVGVICSAPGRYAHRSVVDLVPDTPRVFPVGRLDVATEGLIILTNDGELAYRLAHPRFGVEKEYVVRVTGTVSRDAVAKLRRGVHLDDGLTAPARVSVLGPNALRIVIHEGRNRQIRRMCEAVGHHVVSLARTRIGPVASLGLQPGQWRRLQPSEVSSLWEAVVRARPAQSPAEEGSGAAVAEGGPAGRCEGAVAGTG